MALQRYSTAKPFRSVDDQLDQLIRRGLIVSDEGAARAFLARVNYSRLRPYWHPYEVSGGPDHRFLPGTTFDDIARLYEFDRALRLHLMAAIERIEIALRTRWSYHLSHQFGPFGYLDPSLYRDGSRFLEGKDAIEKSWARQKDHDPVLSHFDRDYAETLPPAWLACELMTFGELAAWIRNLDRGQARLQPVFAGIKDGLGLRANALVRLLPHLNYVRNLAAHHMRLWDRKLTAYTLVTPRRSPRELAEALDATPANRRQHIYRTLVVIGHLTDRFTPGCTWLAELCALFDEYQPMLDRMGFPTGWRELGFWSRCQG